MSSKIKFHLAITVISSIVISPLAITSCNNSNNQNNNEDVSNYFNIEFKDNQTVFALGDPLISCNNSSIDEFLFCNYNRNTKNYYIEN